jgi:hypothetical protein
MDVKLRPWSPIALHPPAPKPLAPVKRPAWRRRKPGVSRRRPAIFNTRRVQPLAWLALMSSLFIHALILIVGVVGLAGDHWSDEFVTHDALLQSAVRDSPRTEHITMQQVRNAAPTGQQAALATRALRIPDDATKVESVIALGPRTWLALPGREDLNLDSLGSHGAAAGVGLGTDCPAAPATPFVRRGERATRIVFLCDASGSKIPNFFNVREQLAAEIGSLRPFQLFNVIFFKNNQTLSLRDGELIEASAFNKRCAATFASQIAPEGRTDPIHAIRAAFALRPDLVCVLTDGFDNADSLARVESEFRVLNSDRRVTVNTVLIPGSIDPQLEAALRRIASHSGGQFRAVVNKRVRR